MKKTLTIHPSDATTDFLSESYSDKNWTVITTDISKKQLKDEIKAHDRIIMLGHGTEKGLIGIHRYIIDSTLVYLLREKECIFVWCNADVFVKKYKLNGFYTGMIISEYQEAIDCSISKKFTDKDIDDSNSMFALALKHGFDADNMLEYVISNYHSNTNIIIEFNQENIYFR